jgi:hypothetical protein
MRYPKSLRKMKNILFIVFDITYLTKIQKFLNPLLRKTDSLS